MPLPSQYARPVNRRSHMSRRRRKGRRRSGLLVVAVALLGLAVVTWILWPRPINDNGSPLALRTGDTTTSPVPAAANPAPTPPTGSSTADTPATSTPVGRDTPRTPPPAALTEASPPPPPVREPTILVAAPESSPPPLAAMTGGEQEQDEPESSSPPAAAPPLAAPSDSATRQRALQRVATARDHASSNDPVVARRLLSEALASGALSNAEATDVRAELQGLNARLVFGPNVAPNDPFAMRYVVQPGDSLQRIVKRLALQVDWRFIQRINEISRPERIQAGQTIKIITGPFHAVVNKSAYRMDLWLGDAPTRDYVCSLPVGLGELNSTPEGLFRVRPNSKVINPEWVNPRSRERFLPNDPLNPIGEHWIGLEGLDEHLRGMTAYGIHGTIEPDSIGRQASMGCVRMLPEDVALVYEMLVDGASTIEIRR